MKTVVELQNVERDYSIGDVKLRVLKGVSLKIRESEMVSITGPSGSGKSTILNMLGALDRPTKGKVVIDGVDISKLDDDGLAELRREKIGYIFQFFYLISSLTALKNVELPMTLKGISTEKKEKRAMELLKMVGLEHRINHRPSQMSGGESQRVAIARALANNPKIILADEPTGNLDSKSGKEIMDILLKLNREEGVTLIIVTHDSSITKCITSKECNGRLIRVKDGMLVKGD
ncbi:MAG: ABC transporter ATP-binding protein [Candidatus Aenigmatarchaeota archaeon]